MVDAGVRSVLVAAVGLIVKSGSCTDESAGTRLGLELTEKDRTTGNPEEKCRRRFL
jgi:hypothetical protein